MREDYQQVVVVTFCAVSYLLRELLQLVLYILRSVGGEGWRGVGVRGGEGWE